RYLSKLFRFMAIILLLLLVAEIATGLYAQGAASIPTLLGEASRLIVLAGVLWGTGDLAHLLIDVGHDVRASRVLLARQTYHIAHDALHDRPFVADRASRSEEHTSELQSRGHLVCRLLLEKKKLTQCLMVYRLRDSMFVSST